MKKINYITIATLVVLMFTVTSCKKKWLDPSINSDPNAVTDVPGFVLLPSIEAQMGYILGGMDVVGTTSMWDQYAMGGSRQAAAIEGYIFKSSDVDNVWSSFYDGGMMDTKVLMDKSLNPKTFSPIYGGISKILMAVWLGNATDLWGDVPYSEAFLGDANLTPKYDPQQQVYDSIQSLLSSAINLLQQTPTAFDQKLSTSDYFYGGDADAWIKVAWSLKARYTLHLSNKNTTTWASDIINIVENQNVMTANSDDLAFKFGTGPSVQNPMYQFEDQRGDMKNDVGFFNSLTSDSNDPRGVIYQATSQGADYFAGIYYGEKDSPVELMTYSELMFIAAEAYHQEGNYDQAKAYIINGITSSINKYKGINEHYDSVSDAWLATKIATYDGTENSPSLTDILTQKYVADYLKPESFVDYRRTGIPQLTPVNTSGIPDRYPYATAEVLYNKNTPTTTLYTKMWWQGN